MLEAGQRFISFVGKEKCDKSVLSDTARVGALLEGRFGGPEGSRLAALAAARVVRRKKTPIQWADLVKLIVSDLQEEEVHKMPIKIDLERVAWHEAGHALMLCLMRDGERVPDFVSVVPANDAEGVTTDSFSYRSKTSKFDTVEDFIDEIRVSLAGRAAEEIAYGPAGVSNGCGGDLEHCTRLARRAFSSWGFAGDHSTTALGSKNLAVAIREGDETETPRLDNLVRNFLSVQYAVTFDKLSAQMDRLEKIKEMLVKKGVVLCADLENLIPSVRAA
jgi:cell division protease FtsH